MTRRLRFRTILPVAEFALAALFGGLGLWERAAILNRPGFGAGQTLWDSTARFHVWPWPFRFAVVTNLPAFLAWSLLGWPISLCWPTLPEGAINAPSLLLVAMLWYWVGSRLDRRWSVSDKAPWLALFAFSVVSLAGALVRLGYVDYLSYGFVIWVIVALTIFRFTRTCSGILAPDLNSMIHHS
jgi:hypothetical protein